MRARKTTDSKDELIDKITGKHSRQQAITRLIEVNTQRHKNTKVFVSSKTVFPKEKEFYIEVDKKATKEQIAEKIKRRMGM